MITHTELFLSVLLAFGIGGLLGVERGYEQACARAKELQREHATGERLVQTPRRFQIDAVVYGSEWLAMKLCQGR